MAPVFARAALVSAGVALPAVVASTITPVQSVLNMLADMKVKGENSLETEQKVYAQYAEWVDDQTRELGFSIKTETREIEKLIAFIDDADSKVSQLGQEIQDLDGEIANLEAAKADSTAVRQEQNAAFLKLEQDYSESVDALERAIATLAAQPASRPEALMLLQRMATTTPAMNRVLAAFLASDTDRGTAGGDGAPAVAGYKFQSGNIVATLEALEKKFKSELDDVQKDESNKAHYYNLEQIHLKDTIAKAKKDREAKAALKASKSADSAKAKGQLAETKEDKAADEKELEDMHATFEAKTTTFHENQNVRKNEIDALSQATEILSSPDVSASYKTHINLVEVAPRAASFLQMASMQKRASAQRLAVELLQKRARALSSKTLAAFAIQAAANPFEKVIGMIESMLAKLKEEAAAEAEHKAWCDEQLKNNKLKRNKLTDTVGKLIAEIEAKSADIATLGEEIDTLAKEQADLAKAMDEATTFRSSEHAENTATIADAVAGQKAVKNALEILREFYSSQGTFLQRQVPAMEAYKGQQDAKGGPIGMLEVILTDFARLQSETESAEAQAAAEYSTFMDDSTASKKQKHKTEVNDRLAKDQAEFEKSELKKDLAANEEGLSVANQYYETLKPQCTEVHVSYEERVAKREAELASLNEAYAILDQKGQ